MIAFATLWLGIVAGAAPVEVLVGPEVARVELRLDGAPCATLVAPPWRATCDLGAAVLPHELVAASFDRDGRPLAEARQWLNLPRPAAELEVAVSREDGAEVARLAWAGPAGEAPREVRVWLDGVLQPPLPDPAVFALPPATGERTRLLRVEVEFSGGVVASRDLAVGGAYANEMASELTAVPVVEPGRLRPGAALRVGDAVLPVLGLDEGLADLVAVVDPAALPGVVALAQAAGRQRVTRSGPGLTGSVRAYRADPTSLAEDHRLRLVWPVPQRHEAGEVGYELFPNSAERASAHGSLLAQLAQASGFATPQAPPRLADAVALAGVLAAQQGRRRAVLLVLGPSAPDASAYDPATIRAYLASLRVPLHVWTTGEPAGAAAAGWGSARPVTSVPRLTHAARLLFGDVRRQRIAWVAGRHLPQAIAPAQPAEWRLAGVGDLPAASAEDDAALAAAEATAAAAEAEAAATVAAATAAGPPPGTGLAGQATPGVAATAPGQPLPAALVSRPLGPFTLATDVAEERLVARLAAAAESLPAVWAERFGLRPVAAGEVVLFAREADFRAWLAGQQGAADTAIEGFAIRGTAGLHAGSGDADAVAGLLVHELSHLLGRAAFGRPLPPWLEEGLAEELALGRFDRQGALLPATLRSERTVRAVGDAGSRRATHVERTVSGPAASLVRLVSTPSARVPLPDLLARDAAAFTAPRERQGCYATAAFLVRFLLAPASGHAERFRGFLAAVAAGGAADGPALAAALGTPLAELDAAYAAWLRRLALAGGE